LEENENDLQRFADLPSVMVRSGFVRLQSKIGCGILSLLNIVLSMKLPILIKKTASRETSIQRNPQRVAICPSRIRKGELMTRMIKHWKAMAVLLTLALAFFMPTAISTAAGSVPSVSLYSPTTDAAASANQKIIFRLDQRVTLASDINITVTPSGGATYTAVASSGTLLGNQSVGPWYVRYDLGDFVDDTSTALSLSAGVTYDVTANAGAFISTDSTPSAQLDASFTTVSGGLAVIFTKTNDTQSFQANSSAIVSGQAVASGSTIAFTNMDDGSYVLVKSVKVNGVTQMGVDLSSYSLTGDLEAYYSRTDGTLTGTVTISGNEYFGGTLSGTLTGSNQPDTSGITFTWVRQGDTDTTLTSGAYGTTYTLVEADIGKIIRLDVTDATLTSGVLTDSTTAIAKAPYSGTVVAPVALSTTDTSVTLTTVSGYEYMISGGDWQDSPIFTGLTTGTQYGFYQRVKATTTTLASETSDETKISTMAILSGSVSFSGTAQSGVALTGSLSESNASGTIAYLWKRGDTTVGTTATYTPTGDDVGSTLTLTVSTTEQSGTISGTTTAVLKAVNATVPAAPTQASATATSITLTEVSGYQYSLGGTYWQDTTTFHNLVAGATYTFYQRVAETTTTYASAASASANFSTLPALTGTVMSSGEARYGITITVSLSDTNNTGTLTYTWKRGTVTVGTGTSYVVQAADISNTLSVEVTSSVQGGSVTRSFGTVAKAYYVGDAPSAPTRYSRTTTKIVLNTVDGCEYSRGGTTWQDSTTFSGLSSGTSYTFYQRYKATATTEASDKSAAYSTYTVTASTSDDDDEDTATPTPTASSTSTTTDDSSGTTLYTYTLTEDNTRILYSTMKSLAAGNKTQDVTIKQDNVEFTFAKGTMTDTYTQLWYDFGTTINSSIAEQTAKEIAGDAYVATIHFNYSGDLPGEATIRFWLGAAQAGKTLYYYLLNDDNTLTFMQTTTVDSSGWATVTQSHCSDYVFLNQDINDVSTSPTPSPSADLSATPSPSDAASGEGFLNGIASDGWFIAAIILIAIALIVGGIWLYTKNRDEY